MKPFIETFLSKWWCGYRKGYNAQYALTAMVAEEVSGWKRHIWGYFDGPVQGIQHY